MINDYKFHGATAADVIEEITHRWASYGDQVCKIDLVIGKANLEIEDQIKKMTEELSKMKADSHDKKFEHYSEVNLIYLADLILGGINPHSQSVLDRPNLSTLKAAISQLPQILDSSIALVAGKALLESIKKEVERLGGTPLLKDEMALIQHLRDCISRKTSAEAQICWVAAKINSGQENVHRDNLNAFQFSIEGKRDFIAALQVLSQPIREKAFLYDDASELEDSMKINWIGMETDCKNLIDFLIKNEYIENTSRSNIFIAQHFMFDGKPKSPESIRRLHMGTSGKIEIFGRFLKIPQK